MQANTPPQSARTVFKLRAAAWAVAACFTLPGAALANPVGAQVVAGSAQLQSQGQNLTVTNTPGTIIQWQSFNIANGERTHFQQESAQSAVLNRVVGNNPSLIYGQLSSNGQVFLVNQSGIYVGPQGLIDVSRLVLSTLNLSDSDFLNKRLVFNAPAGGSLLNQGRLTTPLGGSIYLIGGDVRNEGIVTSPQGQIVLAAGNSVSLVDSAGPELSVTLAASQNKAVNLGTVSASGGRIDMFGALLEQQGILQASSASVDPAGRIVLHAQDSALVSGTLDVSHASGKGGTIDVLGAQVTLAAGAVLDARGEQGGGTVRVGGDWQGANPGLTNAHTTVMAAGAKILADAGQRGDGGRVVLWADDTTVFKGQISARGGQLSGDGGQVETSGHQRLAFGGMVDARAPAGKSGRWLIDPRAICIDDHGCAGSFLPANYFGTGDYNLLSTADLDRMAQGADLYLYASDYLAFLPNGGQYTLSAAVPQGRHFSFQAPYIYANGTLDALSNDRQVSVNFSAFDNGNTSFVFPDKRNTIELDHGARILLPGYLATQTCLATGECFVSGDGNGQISLYAGSSTNAPGTIRIASGAELKAGDYGVQTTPTLPNSGSTSTTYRAGNVWLSAEKVRFNGSVEVAGGFMIDALDLSVDGVKPKVRADYFSFNARDAVANFYLGVDQCDAYQNDGCFTDLANHFAGEWRHFNLYTPGNITVVGAFNTRARDGTSLIAGKNLQVNAALDWSAGAQWLGLEGAQITVNQPVTAKSLFLAQHGGEAATTAAGGIAINAPLRATEGPLWLYAAGNYYGSERSQVSINAPLRGREVGIAATGSDVWLRSSLSADGYPEGESGKYLSLGIWLFGNASFTNQGGRISSGTGDWALGQYSAATSRVNLAGLDAVPISPDDLWQRYFVNGNSLNTHWWSGALYPWFAGGNTGNWSADAQAYLGLGTVAPIPTPTPVSAPPVVDPCTVNPQQCVQTETSKTPQIVTSASPATANTLAAALQIDASLTGAATVAGTLAQMAGDNAAAATPSAVQASLAAAVVASGESVPAKHELEQIAGLVERSERALQQADAEVRLARNPEARAAVLQRRAELRQQAASQQVSLAALRAEAEVAAARAALAAADPEQRSAAELRLVQAEALQARAAVRQAEQAAGEWQVVARERRGSAEGLLAEKSVAAFMLQAQARSDEAKAGQALAEATQANVPAARQRAQLELLAARSRLADAEARQADIAAAVAGARSRQSSAEAQQSEAQARSGATPEQRLQATQQAVRKKAEAVAWQQEQEAAQAWGSAKQAEGAALQARAAVHQAAAEVAAAKTPAARAQAEQRLADRKLGAALGEQRAVEQRQLARGQQAKAAAQQIEARALGLLSPGGRALLAKEAAERRAEAVVAQAEAAVSHAEAAVLRAEAAAGAAVGDGTQQQLSARRSELATQREAVAQARTELVQRREERQTAEVQRRAERRDEAGRVFAGLGAQATRSERLQAVALRHELKAEALQPALQLVERHPALADLPPCGGVEVVCVPLRAANTAALPPPPVPVQAFVPQIQRKVALMIGINQYRDANIPPLETALPDAEAVGKVLGEHQGYEVRTLADASRAEIVSSLNQLAREVGENDSVTIYYAGHGYLSEKTGDGYWIPADARSTAPDLWISNRDISRLLNNIPAKQVLLVSDSCYSGALTKGQMAGTVGARSVGDPRAMLARRSVTVMSSGGEEPVSDEGANGHSPFANSLLQQLQSVSQVETAGKLFESIREQVSREAGQVPHYGGAPLAGHTAGADFLVERRVLAPQ